MKRLLTLLVAVVSATGLRAEGYQVNNLSTRPTGMGHVGTAMKLNSESIFFNPAATAFQDSKFDLSVGAAGILSYCTYTPSPTMENGSSRRVVMRVRSAKKLPTSSLVLPVSPRMNAMQAA